MYIYIYIYICIYIYIRVCGWVCIGRLVIVKPDAEKKEESVAL